MFAIIKTGGKQYRVEKDKTIIVEKIDGEVGSEVTFEEVLMIDDKIGEPVLKGAKVVGEILAQKKDDKVIVYYAITHGKNLPQIVIDSLNNYLEDNEILDVDLGRAE